MSIFDLFSKKTNTTSNTAYNETYNQTLSDSYNTEATLNFTKNLSNLQANSFVTNTAIDARREYNLANVGNVAAPSSDGFFASMASALDINKFFDAATRDKQSEALGAMDFPGAVTGISEQLKALTGLQSATLSGQAAQTEAAQSKAGSLALWAVGLGLAAIVALYFIKRRK